MKPYPVAISPALEQQLEETLKGVLFVSVILKCPFPLPTNK